MIKKHTLLLALLFLLAAPAAGLTATLDRVVAVVNEDLITLSELNEEGGAFFAKVKAEAPPHNRAAALRQARQQVLESLIDRKLLLQRAAKRGLTITDAEVDMQYEAIRTRNNLSEAQFTAQLTAMGRTTEQYKETLKAQIVRQRLISYEIHSKVVITGEDIEKYYQEEYGQEEEQDGMHILQIGVSVGGDPAASRMKAEQLRGMVTSGENFSDIAREYSELPSAADGGDIGVFAEDELSAAMRQGLTDLEPGQVSPIIATTGSLQFFKLLSSKKGDTVNLPPLDRVREEIRAILHERQMKEKFDRWVVKLREHSYVKEQL